MEGALNKEDNIEPTWNWTQYYVRRQIIESFPIRWDTVLAKRSRLWYS